MSFQAMMFNSGDNSKITASTEVLSKISNNSIFLSVTFDSIGRQILTCNGSNTVVGNWVVPASTASEWEIRATLLSGVTPSTGTLGVWQPLTTSRLWGLNVTEISLLETDLLFEFRKAISMVVDSVSCTVSLSGEKTGFLP